jgi:DNA-directed RNA polymerase alpha subunit
MKTEDLLEETIKTILNLKPINLHLKEMNELVYNMSVKADFEKVKQYIEYQNK